MNHAFSVHANVISTYRKTFCNANILHYALPLNSPGHMLFIRDNVTFIRPHCRPIHVHILILAPVINNFHDTEMQVESLDLRIITVSHGCRRKCM